MDLSLFGIGLPQILLIMVVALLVFGPEKLPEMARQAGRMLGKFRAWMQDARTELKTLTDVQEEFKTLKEDLASIRKDLTETSQEVLKELDDVRKEVDVRSDLTEAFSDKPLEQYTYHVSDTEAKSEAAREFARLESEITKTVPDNDSKLVSLIEDAMNDANAAALASASNGHKPDEALELTGEVEAATVRLENIAAETDSLTEAPAAPSRLLEEQIAAILSNQEKFHKDFSVLVRHISELTERVSEIEQHPSMVKISEESREKARKAAEMI